MLCHQLLKRTNIWSISEIMTLADVYGVLCAYVDGAQLHVMFPATGSRMENHLRFA